MSDDPQERTLYRFYPNHASRFTEPQIGWWSGRHWYGLFGDGMWSPEFIGKFEPVVCVRLDGLADQIAATFGFRPCGKWSTCSGGDNPTTRLDCSDGQCVNPEHKTRVPCINPWHKIAGFVQSLAVQ